MSLILYIDQTAGKFKMMAIDEHRRMAMEGSNHAIGPVLAAIDQIAATCCLMLMMMAMMMLMRMMVMVELQSESRATPHTGIRPRRRRGARWRRRSPRSKERRGGG